jgi:hypothetical protein
MPAVTPGNAQRWTDALRREAALFEPLTAGSRIGVVAEAILAGAVRASTMLVWQREREGMRAGVERYDGFESAPVDLLIALDEAGVEGIEGAIDGDFVRSLRALVREGHALFFARRPRAELEESGYEDLLDEIGFAYLGACR